MITVSFYAFQQVCLVYLIMHEPSIIPFHVFYIFWPIKKIQGFLV